MTTRRFRPAVVACLGAGVLACSTTPDTEEAASGGSAIERGVSATESAYDAVGALAMPASGPLAPGPYSPFCTGTLVAPTFVVTAKHCVADGNGAAPWMGSGHEVYFLLGPNAWAPARAITVKAAFVSALDEGGFLAFAGGPSYGSDVALDELAESVTSIAPLAIATGPLGPTDVGAKVTAVGYGMVGDGVDGHERRRGTLTVQATAGTALAARFPDDEALLSFAEGARGAAFRARNAAALSRLRTYALLSDHEAWLGTGRGDVQPCSGDSGGPVLRAGSGGVLEVVGVVSGAFKGERDGGGHETCGAIGEFYGTFGPSAQALFRAKLGAGSTR